MHTYNFNTHKNDQVLYKPCNTVGNVRHGDINFRDIQAIIGLVVKENHLIKRNARVLRYLLQLATLVRLVDVEVRVEHIFQVMSFANRKLSKSTKNFLNLDFKIEMCPWLR